MPAPQKHPASHETAVRISPEVRALTDQLIEVRRDFHQNPELAFEEHRTAGVIEARLRALGYAVRTGVAGTGVVAERGMNTGGKNLLLRFDMDALPVTEETDSPFASRNPGKMHACAHDGHMSIGLALAELLARRDHPGGTRFVFQPAEEGPGGAERMIGEGVLENPPVAACLGLHLWNEIPLGQVGVCSGPSMANVAWFQVTVRGRGGHAAMPHQAADALVAAAHLVTALQTIVSRNVDPLCPAVVTVGRFHAGRTHNVIAEEAQLEGTIRTYEKSIQEEAIARLECICNSTVQAFGCTAELSVKLGYPAVINDRAMAELVTKSAGDVVGSERVHPTVTMAADDMAYFLQAHPGCYFFVGSGRVGQGPVYPHHNPRFDFDEGALLIGTEILYRASERYLELA